MLYIIDRGSEITSDASELGASQQMKINDLTYNYPEELIAQTPHRPSRVMCVELFSAEEPREITIQELLRKIPEGDILVINDTQVLKRRVFLSENIEILFLNSQDSKIWEVLFPSKKYKIGDKFTLPLGREAKLTKKGRPQIIEVDRGLDEVYFQEVAELPLPPYIQKARNERHTLKQDETWYQTAWSDKPGSFAAPTASLHFTNEDLQNLKARGVAVEKVTLHVGLGTFLPVTVENLDDHIMHSEYVEIEAKSWSRLLEAKKRNQKIWALGTTSTRALESQFRGMLPLDKNQESYRGFTQLLIQPGFEFQMVDRLLTNFHQPQSTLLALVSAFSDLNKVKACYSWAIERKFQLFSYGDLSVWIR